ncbi:MAG: prepilin peptidase [Planctomycetaceae bacterium]|nr:prepilin peptidase [Planctomycetaceae bacterium]
MTMVTYWILVAMMFVAGLFLARFLNRCIARLPDEFHVIPAWKRVFSREPRVGHYPPDRWYHILPLIGTGTIVGRSPYSGRRIRSREVGLELLNGLLVVATFVCLIPPEIWGGPAEATVVGRPWAGSLFGWQSVSPMFIWGRFLYFLALVELLFVATFIDFDLWIIPDGITVPGMVIGFLGQALGLGFFLSPLWIQDPHFVSMTQEAFPILQFWPIQRELPQWVFYNHTWHALAVSLAGFLVGGGIVWAVRIIGALVLKREAMGFGDVILMAMIGSFIGWQPVIIVFFLAPLMALIVIASITMLRTLSIAKFPAELPYGPYLSLATLVVLGTWKWIGPEFGRIFLAGPVLILLAGLMLVFLMICLWLIQIIKRLIGIEDYWEDESGWRNADQMLFYMGKHHNPDRQTWQRETWPGKAASRGQLVQQHWQQPR